MLESATNAPSRRAARRLVVPVILAAILLLALGARLHYALACTAVPADSDMEYYNVIAEGSGVPTEVPPGYPLFLRLIYAIWGARNYTAVYVVQAVLSAATVFLVFLVTRTVANARAALFAAGIAAVYPSFIAYALTTMTETISLLLVLLLLAALTLPRSERTRSILAAGALALGYLFKPALLFFAPGVLLSAKRKALFLVSLAAIVGPVLAFDLVSGTTALRGARGFYRTYNPATKGAEAPMENTELGRADLEKKTYIDGGFDFLRRNKMKAVDIIYGKASIVLARGSDRFVLGPVVGKSHNVWMLLMYGFVPIMILGFIGMARTFDRKARRIALPVLSYLFFVVLLSIFKTRYRLPAEPAVIVFAGIALDRVAAIRIPRPRLAWLTRLVAPPESGPGGPAEAAPDSPDVEGGRRKGSFPSRLPADWDIACLVLFIALALRLYFAFAAEAPINAREAAAAIRLAESGRLGSADAPIYPISLRGVHAVFGTGYRAIFVGQAILGAVSVLLTYLFVSAVAGRKAGIAAGAIAAVLPDMLVMHLQLSPDASVLLCATGLMTVAASSLSAPAKATLSGFLAGAGILLAPHFAYIVPGALVTQRRWRLFLLALAGTLLPHVLFSVAQHRRLEPVYVPAAYELKASDIFGGEKPWEGVQRIYDNAALAISKRWGIAYDSAASPATRVSSFVSGYGFVAVLYLGLVGLARCRLREHRAVFLPPLLYVLLVIVLSNFQMKHRPACLPAMIACAAMFLTGSCKDRAR